MIKAILAIDENGGIAKDGKIPWHVKEDFAYFKETTIGNGNNVIIMGRKTYESLPSGDLPSRINMIMTHNPSNRNELNHWNQVIQVSEMCEDVFIIGGESIYRQAITKAIPKEIYISHIFGDYNCDKFFDIELLNKNYTQIEQTQFENFNLSTWNKIGRANL